MEAKRAKPADGGGAVDFDVFCAHCVARPRIAGLWALPHASKLLGGMWARCVGKDRPYQLMQIRKVVPAPRPYDLVGAKGGTQRCTVLLLLTDPATGSDKPRAITQVSGSPPTSQEYGELVAALRARGAAGLVSQPALAETLARFRSLAERVESGRPATAGGKPWGQSGGHTVFVVLRSWRADDQCAAEADAAAASAAASKQGGAAATAEGGVLEIDGGVEASARYRVCLDAGSAEPAGAASRPVSGLGPSRRREKWRGSHHFLLQHREPPSGGDGGAGDAVAGPSPRGRLYPLVARASASSDDGEPEATAARCVREFFRPAGDAASGLSASDVAAATLEHRELVPLGAGGGGTGAAGAGGSLAARVALPRRSEARAPFGRAFAGHAHLLFLDLDQLVAAGAVKGGWQGGAGRVGALAALRDAIETSARADESDAASGRKRGREGRSSRPSTSLYRGSLALLSEDEFRALLPAAGSSSSFPPRAVLAADESDPKTSASPPAVVAEVGREEAASMGLGAWQDLVRGLPPRPAEAGDAAPVDAPSGAASDGRGEPVPPPCAPVLPPSRPPLLPDLARALAGWEGPTAAILPSRASSRVTLFHGTSPSLALRALRSGFLRPACRMSDPCRRAAEATEASPAAAAPPRGCECQMMGFAVYLARRDKAGSYAVRRAQPLPGDPGVRVGAVIECAVDLGWTHQAVAEPCACGCGRPFSDHWGTWYSARGCDSVFLDDHSMPATTTAEWAVADPARVVPLKVHILRL